VVKNIFYEYGFDELDRAILLELQNNARITNAELARTIHLSQPAIHQRIKKLEKRGVIQRYSAQVDRVTMGYDLLCLIQIQTDGTPKHWQQIRELAENHPQILECYHLTGEFDVILKVVVRNHADLEQFVDKHFSGMSGIQRIQTNVVLTEWKVTTDIPLK
jgi:DNA-binding Lrp family transcriptional regulator